MSNFIHRIGRVSVYTSKKKNRQGEYFIKIDKAFTLKVYSDVPDAQSFAITVANAIHNQITNEGLYPEPLPYVGHLRSPSRNK